MNAAAPICICTFPAACNGTGWVYCDVCAGLGCSCMCGGMRECRGCEACERAEGDANDAEAESNG